MGEYWASSMRQFLFSKYSK